MEIIPVGLRITFKNDIDDYNKKIINGNINNLKNLLIAIIGPVFSFFIAIIFYFFSRKFYFLKYMKIIVIAIYVNLTIGTFNLIPIYPLDGGRVLKEFLYLIIGKKKAMEIINQISNVLTIVLTIISGFAIYKTKNIAIIFVLIFLWVIRIKENKKYKLMRRLFILIETTLF